MNCLCEKLKASMQLEWFVLNFTLSPSSPGGPGGPPGPGRPTGPWIPSLPAGPWGPFSPYNRLFCYSPTPCYKSSLSCLSPYVIVISGMFLPVHPSLHEDLEVPGGLDVQEGLWVQLGQKDHVHQENPTAPTDKNIISNQKYQSLDH